VKANRKSAANRRNSQKSCGPRTAAGKLIASRNALKHGLSAVVHRQPVTCGDVERLATAICGGDGNAVLLEQARVIAANELVLRAINVQKIAVVERLGEPTAIALVKGDNSWDLATAKFMEAWLAHREIEALVPKVSEKYKNQMLPPLKGVPDDYMVPIRIKALLEEPGSTEQREPALKLARGHLQKQERDIYEALEEAAADLVRLDRYERRTWSRQKRAIGSFVSLKMMSDPSLVVTWVVRPPGIPI
jgi:hypothetical protein